MTPSRTRDGALPERASIKPASAGRLPFDAMAHFGRGPVSDIGSWI
jgi:hypothetical protein